MLAGVETLLSSKFQSAQESRRINRVLPNADEACYNSLDLLTTWWQISSEKTRVRDRPWRTITNWQVSIAQAPVYEVAQILFGSYKALREATYSHPVSQPRRFIRTPQPSIKGKSSGTNTCDRYDCRRSLESVQSFRGWASCSSWCNSSTFSLAFSRALLPDAVIPYTLRLRPETFFNSDFSRPPRSIPCSSGYSVPGPMR